MRSCKTAQVLMAKEQAQELSEHEQGYLQSHIQSCASCRERSKQLTSFFESLGSLGRVRTAPSAAARTRFITQTKALQPIGPRVPLRKRTSARSRISSRAYLNRAGGRYLLASAAAAAVLLVAGVLWMTRDKWQRPDDTRVTRPPVAQQGTAEPPVQNTAPVLLSARGAVTVQRAGRLMPASANLELLTRDQLETAEKGAARIRYPDGTIVDLNSNSLVLMNGESSGKRLTLERGDIFADVARQPRGAPMILNPGRADQVRVVGTAFELSRRNECTRLRMAAGLTSFGPSDRAVAVKEGFSSLVEQNSTPSAPSPCDLGSIADWRSPVGEPAAQPGEGGAPAPSPAAPGTSEAEGGEPLADQAPVVPLPVGPAPAPGPVTSITVVKPPSPAPQPAVPETESTQAKDKEDPAGDNPGQNGRDKSDKDRSDKAKDDPKAEAKAPELPAVGGSKPAPPVRAPKAGPKPVKSK